VEERADQVMWWLIVIAALCAVIAGVFLVWFPKVIVRPIDELKKGITEIANHKLQEMPSRVTKIWHGIKCRARVDDVVRGAVPWIKTRLVYPLFMRFLTSPKPFHFTDACIGCGLCARVCPLKNISMQQNHPHWGKDCTLCLGCYHACPTHAVAYGHATDHKAQKQTVNISR
jgi:ferredoxin